MGQFFRVEYSVFCTYCIKKIVLLRTQPYIFPFSGILQEFLHKLSFLECPLSKINIFYVSSAKIHLYLLLQKE